MSLDGFETRAVLLVVTRSVLNDFVQRVNALALRAPKKLVFIFSRVSYLKNLGLSLSASNIPGKMPAEKAPLISLGQTQ